MKIGTLGLCLLIILAGALQAQAILQGGFARINITPDKPVTLSGYASRKALSTGVHDSLYARASLFALDDQKLIFISLDIIGFYNETDSYFHQLLIDEFGFEPGQIFLTAIHTHSAPTLVLDKAKGHPNNYEYTLELGSKLLQVVNSALSAMQPIKIRAGTGSSPVGVNRRELVFDKQGNSRIKLGRNPQGVTDPQVQVLEVTGADNNPLALCWNYATHSTALGPKNLIISGDVHGIAEQHIEQYMAHQVIAPAFAGASGDIDPWFRVISEIETRNGWIPEPVLLGTLLGQEVVHITRQPMEEVPVTLIRSEKVTIRCPGKPRNIIEIPSDTLFTDMTLSVARLGNIAFVGLGGEILCEIGLAIKQASPFAHTFVISHCNGAAGYLAPKHRYLEGGYEIKTSPFAPSAADNVVKRALMHLHRL